MTKERRDAASEFTQKRIAFMVMAKENIFKETQVSLEITREPSISEMYGKLLDHINEVIVADAKFLAGLWQQQEQCP